ncbi:MAG: AAA family ATPase, partial [Candidatus Zixiibacteriota bacterium]
MIIKSRYPVPTMSGDTRQVYPVLPLLTGVLFPGAIFTIQVGQPRNLALINHCRRGKKQFVAAYARSEFDTNHEPPVHQVGVFATVRNIHDGAGGSKIVVLEGLRRAALHEVINRDPYLTATATPLEPPQVVSAGLKKKMAEVISTIGEITQLNPVYSPELSKVLKLNEEDPSMLADRVAASFHFSLAAKQELLEAIDLELRYDRLLFFLNNELNQVATLLNIEKNVKERIQEEQHKYYLRQQLYEIRRQLGEDFTEEKEAARLRKLVKNSPNLPPEVVARAMIEIDRLSQLSPASAEYGVTKSYLDWLLNLPWGKVTPENYTMEDVERVLSSDYYGPVKLKEQIMQRISVRKLLGGLDESPTLCLVGAPGTGKASLARAIAKALGKEFVRISVGGISDVSDIKGTARTWLGAYPGKIMRVLRNVGASDPVVLIEDIDYFNVDNDSSVNIALLEAIDARNNRNFLDNYIGIPFDLSKVIFICSVRS